MALFFLSIVDSVLIYTCKEWGIILGVIMIFYLFMKQQYRLFFYVVLIIAIFEGYLSLKINNYDTKYQEGEYEDFVKIVSNAEDSKYYWKYVCKNSQGDKFLLYLSKNETTLFENRDEIYIKGNLTLFDEDRNEGGFNQRRYYNSHGVFGKIMTNKINMEKKGRSDFISQIRQHIEKVFHKILPMTHANLISAMINGNKNLIDKETKEDFKKSGVSHLLAVSGTHVSYIVLFLSIAMNRIFGRKISNFLSIAGIILYIFIAGTSYSVIRAGIMAILNVFAMILSRKPISTNNLMLSLIIILLINPLAFYDSGLVLSAVGTFGVITLSPILNQFFSRVIKNKVLRETLSVSLSAQMVLFPLIVVYYHTISFISILFNILIVPVSGVLIILGIFTIIVGSFSIKLANFLSYSIYIIISYIFGLTHAGASIPFGVIIVNTPRWWMILSYYLLLWAMFTSSKMLTFFSKEINLKKGLMYISSCIILIGYFLSLFPANSVMLNMIDVGQGDCFYIETIHHKVVLIDTGGSEMSDYDVGENILVPYLLQHGKKEIELIVISHPHEDHIEGIFPILEKLKVKQVVIGKNLQEELLIQRLKETCQNHHTNIIEVSAGDSFMIDGVSFQVIFPSEKDKFNNLNNLSLVIKMTYGKIATLFTGDLEDENEDIIHIMVDVDILKVGHHGSSTSTSLELIKNTTPQIALISVGKNNSYGHPSDMVLERLAKYHAKVYRTDEMGEVCLKIRKNKIEVKSHL